jgi:hypothetical protein
VNGSEKKALLAEELARRYGRRVLAGPFAGMAYVGEAVGSELLPKLLGTYELELHFVLEALLRRPWERVINVGCGEGYYAVGLALRLPAATVHAFDTDATARRLGAELAALNGVSNRLRLAAACPPSCLHRLAGRNALLLCDCEGDEWELLRPDAVPTLARCTMLVELHEFLRPGVTRELLRRFAGTHLPAFIPAVERAPGLADQALALAPLLTDRAPAGPAPLGPEERWLALSEARPPGMGWLFLNPQPCS